MDAKRDVVKRLPHPQYPVKQERLPEAQLAPNRQHGAMPGRDCHLMTGCVAIIARGQERDAETALRQVSTTRHF